MGHFITHILNVGIPIGILSLFPLFICSSWVNSFIPMALASVFRNLIPALGSLFEFPKGTSDLICLKHNLPVIFLEPVYLSF